MPNVPPHREHAHRPPLPLLGPRYGSWGVCFTYAGWFGCAALGALGHSVEDDPALARAAAFIVTKQRLDGGWGESYLSCQDKVRGVGGELGGRGRHTHGVRRVLEGSRV